MTGFLAVGFSVNSAKIKEGIWPKSDNIMSKRNGMSETKVEITKGCGFDLNECPNVELMEQADESGLKAELETDSLVNDGIDRAPNGGNMKNVTGLNSKKTVKLKPPNREVLITRRVLRSGSVASDQVKSDKHHRDVEKKRKVSHKGDMSKGDNMGKVSSISSVVDVKEEVEHEHVKSLVPKETHGDGFKSLIKVDYKDDKSDDEKELKFKRKRGRPPKSQSCSQSDDKEVKLIGGSCFGKEKTEVKLEDRQAAEVNKMILGADDIRSQVKVEIKDDRSYDENGNVEPHGEEPKAKRKRGRPRKCHPDESGSNTNCKLVRTPDLSSQSSLDRLSLKPQRGRPPKTKETAVALYVEKENINRRYESTLITLDQSMTDSIDESSRPKSNYGGRAKGLESDGGSCRGRKMLRKRGRPPTPQKERNSWGADESGGKAKKRLKLRESSLESRHNNPLTDGEKENKQNEAEKQSKSKSKKMLSDRILQLLLAAGWRVEYRPRNGRAYRDAVYVNPEGKTHWSVTKAYSVYKEQLESSMNDQKNSTTGSGFGLLPEEDLHLLWRKTQKKRCDTGKRRANWKDRDANENMVSTKGNGKRTLHGKKVWKEKNRMQKKRKGSHGSHNLERISVSVRKIKREEKHNRCGLSARSSLDNAEENGYILFEGKRTMLGWMIDSAIVPLNGKVQCMNCEKTQVLLEGIITKDGIRCNCCDEVFSALDFEVHAGAKHDPPFKSLYLEGGNSLLRCFLESWNKQSESQLKGFHFVDFGVGDPNDDTCANCGDGGDLICCDGCPSTFHQSCLGIKKFPSGAWFCCYCSCKFCEKVEADNNDPTTLTPLLRCCLCEEKYHQECIKQDSMLNGERITDSFCGKYCQELFKELQLLIGVKHALPEGFSWTFLRRFELPREVADCDISEKIAYNAKLAVAFSVMDECFSPLVDHRSGDNLLQNIVYNFGSNFHRLNYSSFLTAVLERGEEIIAVASIRIHGNQLAEMPFIGTRYMYRRQGMCRRLMSGIESALGSLKVDKLVIPAVPELMDTWTSGFGFRPVHESAKKAIKNLNLLVFPGVDMLEKSLVKEKITESNVSSSNGYSLLAPEKSMHVDVDEDKPEESKDSAAHWRNCATADVKSPSYPVDSCLKLMNVEEREKDTESNLKLLNGYLEEKEEIGKLTDKEVDSLPDVVDNQRESNTGMADGSRADKGDSKRQESDDLEDKTPLSDDSGAVKAEESDDQPDCYIVEHSGNGGTEKEINKKSLARKKGVASRIRVSRRLIQRSWGTTGVNA
ncbi:unnamed protein product [Arabis nemorensis]|uniref:PHD-type domain-containing protein n=1 Tax=Arabis nemorensis TaxID=586526 RepID=A0A565BK40_9BRAS|nr:unnamed protein product [Arabis nemorensis]